MQRHFEMWKFFATWEQHRNRMDCRSISASVVHALPEPHCHCSFDPATTETALWIIFSDTTKIPDRHILKFHEAGSNLGRLISFWAWQY